MSDDTVLAAGLLKARQHQRSGHALMREAVNEIGISKKLLEELAELIGALESRTAKAAEEDLDDDLDEQAAALDEELDAHLTLLGQAYLACWLQLRLWFGREPGQDELLFKSLPFIRLCRRAPQE